MKWSFYNELIDRQDGKEVCFLFNPLRERYFVLDSALKELIQAGIDNPSYIAKSHTELYQYLVKEKFIITDEEDEVAECVAKINNKFSSEDYLRITINPTLDCNLRCWYCYESHHKGSCMSNETIDALMLFIEKKVNGRVKKLQLSFFGGEPLLKYDRVVKPIIERTAEICRRHGKPLMLSFTSNGVCLTSKIVDELRELSPEVSIQIAFDGNQSCHDAIKRFPNGKGCYERVKNQLSYAIEKGLLTVIRCNYTLANIDSFIEVIEDFKKYWYRSNVKFSFHKVWQEPESSELFTKREKLKKYVTEIGIQSNIESYYGDSLIPCYADYDSHIVINYNGDIFKCTARDFKPENRLGYINDNGEIIYGDSAKKTIEFKLTQQCSSCRLLPICTICFQRRRESANGACPSPMARESASINIQKYFHDIISLNK